MPDLPGLTLFLAAAVVLLVTPGPAVFYIVARSVEQGRMAGFVSALGAGVGTLFHIAAAAVGVSALLLSSALAFGVVKYLGAAYLILLGVRTLLAREEIVQPEIEKRPNLARIFYQAVFVNLLNPKTALFFFAFLPQFIDTSKGAVAAQIVFLGIGFIIMGLVSDSVYALLAGTIGGWLKGNLKYLRTQRYLAGTVYIGLGVGLALSGSNKDK